MCVSAKPADFRSTSLLVNLIMHPVHGEIFVLGYQNTAINYHNGPNAMLLHFPAQEMSQANFINTQGCAHIFDDMRSPFQPVEKGLGQVAFSRAPGKVEVFDHDIYTVVLANDARDIPAALIRVPAHKQPDISDELCEFYALQYPGWPIALCCFKNKDARRAMPLLVWYKPFNTDVFIAPAIDSHTGGLPNLRGTVEVDHWIFMASHKMSGGISVRYRDTAAQTRDMLQFLPSTVRGVRFKGSMNNGDFVTGRHLVEAKTPSIFFEPDDVKRLVPASTTRLIKPSSLPA